MPYKIKFLTETQKWRVFHIEIGGPDNLMVLAQDLGGTLSKWTLVKEFCFYLDAKKFVEEQEADETEEEEEICEECGKRLVEGDDDDDICSAGCPAYDAGWAETHPDVSQCIQEVLDYIYDSEMGGEVDEEDSWFPVYQSLQELKEKVDEEENIVNRCNYPK